MKALTAAGGWVRNDHGQVLWIYRLGHWDLPKGKLETGENIEDCAVREVEEECGLTDIRLGKKLTETVHEYIQNGEHYRKTTHWYAMEVEGCPVLSPQTEEGIEWVRWVSEEEWSTEVARSYSTIQAVVAAARL